MSLHFLPARRFMLCLVLSTLGLFSAGIVAAQETTASMRIVIADQDGASVSGVPMLIHHIPTGRKITQSSNASGIVTARGLAVGGPYEVSVAETNRFSADVIQGIYLELDKTEVVPFAVRPYVEEVVVTAEGVSDDLAVGIGAGFDRAQIDATPSVSRDFVSTLARDP